MALALAIEPRLPTLLHSLIAMGGAVHTAGNASPLAEANFLHDAPAARAVVHAFSAPATCPFVLAPLDVTNPALVGAETIGRLARSKAARMFADAVRPPRGPQTESSCG